MFGSVRLAVRAFFVGMLVGFLVAPRPGAETRRLLREKFVELGDALMELLAIERTAERPGGTAEPSATPRPRRRRAARGD